MNSVFLYYYSQKVNKIVVLRIVCASGVLLYSQGHHHF
jgi:hypothetical protein